MAITDRLTETLGVVATMRRAGLIAPMRPDKYVRIAAAMQRENMGVTSGFAAAAQRCPDRPGLVDELGTLTWREIDRRADAFAAGLQALPVAPKVVGLMARNHRGFVEALDRRQPDRRRRASAEHVVRRTGVGRCPQS